MANNIRNDSRFAHIASDPRFKRIHKNERKVKIDKRFQSMFNDGKFKLKYTVDKRGRPGDHTSNEDLKRYYELSSEESESDSGGTEEESDEKAVKKSSKVHSSSDCDSESNDESEAENDLENGNLELPDDIKEKLHDTKVDYARGEAVLLSDSSSDEESSEDELEADVRQLDHGWGELDRDAERTEEITNRLAVCNMDWDRIRSSDLMVLFSSFLPPGGIIHTVSIYPSEFGLERMKQEESLGPVELTAEPVETDTFDDDNVLPDDETEEGSKYHMEKLRQYQLARLKYYYAVIVFDSATSANKVYTDCDGMEYESSSARLDLRFIPDDTTFDQEPREVCDRLPEPSKYEPRHFTTTALQQAKVELTWDETDPRRCEVTRKIAAGTADEIDLQTYLASSSGEEEVEEDKDVEDSDDEKPAKDPTAKYRALLQGIEAAEEEKKSRGVEMEVTWGLGLKDKTQKLVNKKIREGDGLTPFQQLMEKKREKKRAKREERKKKLEQIKEKGDEDDEADNPYSDDDIPSDVDMNDPYFKEEFADEPSKPSKKSKKKKHVVEEEDEESKRKRAELELLLMDGDDNRQHFNLKEIQEKELAATGSKKKRRKLKKRAEKEPAIVEDDFQVNVKDDRFSAIFSSHHFNIDPADPHFRKTKGMEALRAEKLKRRNISDQDSETQVSAKATKVDSGKKRDAELSLLVKSVKRKSMGM